LRNERLRTLPAMARSRAATGRQPHSYDVVDTGDTTEVADLRSLWLILIGFAGGLTATAIVFLGFWSWPSHNTEFAQDGAFLIWFFLIAVQVAAWPLAVALTLGHLRRVRRVCPGGGKEVAVASSLFVLAALAVAALGVFGLDLPQWLPDYRTRILILSLLGIGTALVPAVVLLKVQVGLRTLGKHKAPGRREIKMLLQLKEALSTSLGLLGILLSLAIVAAAAERNAVGSYTKQFDKRHDINEIFPLDYVTLYGLLLSILIAIAYAPAHISYLAVGRRFRETLFPVTAPDEGWQAEVDKRTAFDGLLELGGTTGANLKTSIFVLGPLLTSLTGLLSK
jgi:hypothetical protein